jgi:hypothetical protein
MQIKFILAAAGTVACLSGAIFGMQAIAENSKFSEDGMAKNSKRDIADSVRNTRPAKDHHKDARKCLNEGKNEAVIRCAQKYR